MLRMRLLLVLRLGMVDEMHGVVRGGSGLKRMRSTCRARSKLVRRRLSLGEVQVMPEVRVVVLEVSIEGLELIDEFDG